MGIQCKIFKSGKRCNNLTQYAKSKNLTPKCSFIYKYCMICIDKEYKWNSGSQENMKYFFNVLFHERLWPIRKGDWSKQLNVLNGWWTLVDLLRSWLHVRYSHYPKYLMIHVPNSNECLCNYLICLVSKISTFHWLFVMPNVPLWLIDQYNLYE